MENNLTESKRSRRTDVLRLSWAILGVLALVAILGLVLRELAMMVIPLVLALFPASLLAPLARLLERGRVPTILATLITLVGGLSILLGIVAGTVTLVVAQLPDIVDSAAEGVERVEELVSQVIPGFQIAGVDELGERILERIQEPEEESSEGKGEESTSLATKGLNVARSTMKVLAGIALMVVTLFFYIKGGRSLASGFVGFLAPQSRERVMGYVDQAWKTLGAYFRGQLLVALSDAVLIGIGLLALGVPLAFPLAILVFFGGLFPIVGALVSGALAVLVAFADGGLGVGLAVVGIVLVVQQLEGNVLEPLIMSNVIDLHPLTVILSITLGALVLGVIGAFLAVPAAAIAKQVVVRWRKEREAQGLGSSIVS